jgi:hypothetical protein
VWVSKTLWSDAMFAFLFKAKPEILEADPNLELARLALQDRVDEFLAREVRRRLRHVTISTPLHQ